MPEFSFPFLDAIKVTTYVNLEFETDFIVEPTYNTIGAFEVGTEPIGGTIEEIDELNVFLVFFRLPRQKPYNIQLTAYGDGTNVDGTTVGNRWAIEQIFVEPKDAERQIPKEKIKYFKTT